MKKVTGYLISFLVIALAVAVIFRVGIIRKYVVGNGGS